MFSETDLENSDPHWVDIKCCKFTSFLSWGIMFGVLKSWGSETFKNGTFTCKKINMWKIEVWDPKNSWFLWNSALTHCVVVKKVWTNFRLYFLESKSARNERFRPWSLRIFWNFWKIFPGRWDILLWISKNPWFSNIFKDLEIVDLQAVTTLSATPSYEDSNFKNGLRGRFFNSTVHSFVVRKS